VSGHARKSTAGRLPPGHALEGFEVDLEGVGEFAGGALRLGDAAVVVERGNLFLDGVEEQADGEVAPFLVAFASEVGGEAVDRLVAFVLVEFVGLHRALRRVRC